MRYSIMILICFLFTTNALGAIWNGSDHFPGVNGPVNTMIIRYGELHIGGVFDTVGSQTIQSFAFTGAYNIWRGTFYFAHGEIIATTQSGEFMYALARSTPGDFSSSIQAYRLVPPGWEPIGPPVPTLESAICAYQNGLHVGPYRLIDNEWVDILNADNGVTQLKIHAGDLILSGPFLHSGEQLVNHIATWNDGVINPLGLGLATTPVDLLANDDALYVLMDSGWATSFDLNIWSGHSWSTQTHPDEAWNGMNCLAFYRDDIVVVGHFGNYIDSPTPIALTFWNGVTWAERIPFGFGTVSDAISWNNELVLCGQFRGSHETTSLNLVAYGENGWRSLFPRGRGIWWDNTDIWPYQDRVISYRPADSHGPFDPIFDIVQSNSSTWSVLTTTTYGPVLGMLSDGAEIAMIFQDVGQQSTAGVWESGESWNYLPPSTQTPTIFHNGTLYSPGNIILKSEAGQWVPMMESVTGSVSSLGIWNDQLVASGEFTAINGEPVRRLAIITGGSWQEIGGGLNGPVDVLCEWNGKLVVAGDFTEAGGLPVPGLAVWSGHEWTALGESGVDGTINAMDALDSRLFIGGDFSSIDGMPASNLARYDGSNWSTVADSFNGHINNLHAWNSRIFISGDFTYVIAHDAWGDAYNPHMYRFASRYLFNVANDPQNPEPTDLPITQTTIPPNTPNPFNPSTEIRFDLARPGLVHLTVHDTRGRLVRTLLNEPRGTGSATVTWDGCDDRQRALPSGVYIVKLQTAEESASRKVTLAR